MAAEPRRADRPGAGRAAEGAHPAPTKRLRLEYFAQFREKRGLSFEDVETSSRTAAELYEELEARYHFGVRRATTRVAVNDALVPWGTRLGDGDTVVFLTPFGGG